MKKPILTHTLATVILAAVLGVFAWLAVHPDRTGDVFMLVVCGFFIWLLYMAALDLARKLIG
jgi:protein involved in temperature-dependent protein secretion